MNKIEHLLVCLAEECAEVIQRATKANRFGLNEIEPGQDMTNAGRIVQEFYEAKAVVQMLQAEGVLVLDSGCEAIVIAKKKERVMRYMEYAEKCGALSREATDK